MKTHAEWVEAVKQASAGGDKSSAARALERIAQDIGDAEEAGFSPWHLVQTLGLAALYFEEAGMLVEAQRVLRDCLNVTRDQLVQASRAHAEICSRLATILIDGGSEAEGSELGSEALQALATAPEPSLALEEFLAAWRKNATRKPGAV